ncbi:AAA family ATPase [bacterium]|nr:AAA family ATPase [bacterium]
MDKGAHSYKCDFQVHTPRDINWHGQGATTDAERRTYADEFIAACREKGLNAVAITDHHDLVFFKYVKEAADNEVGEDNNPIPPEKRIIVFPGMELTLARPPCQAILILDSDFPVNLLPTLHHNLAITQTDSTEDKQAPVERLERIQSFEQLYELLNQHDYLKDRFVVLPNVSESTNVTLLRSGFHDFYKKMPCVGGYLDGSYEQLGEGNIRILSGRDRHYGPKRLGIFQTSDNRRRDHHDLGTHATWVKWAIPTAEALRQACLAKESRISQIDPALPSVYVTSVDVSNSKFMGPIYLELNRQYNALIGGRGTGKSTILEYLRWGLCDQPPDFIKSSDFPEFQERRKNLIEKTLLAFDSTIQISFVKNNVPHIIRRRSQSTEIFLKIGDSEFELCKESDVRNLLPIQAYSQKQLSSVGVSIEELKRLIYSPIRQVLNEFNSKFKELSSEVRNCYELRQRKMRIQKEVEKDELELKSLTEQVDNLRKGLKGISDKDREIISIHSVYEDADGLIEGWRAEIQTVKEALEDLKSKVEGLPAKVSNELELPKTDLDIISKISKKLEDIFIAINKQILTIDNLVGSESKEIGDLNGLIDKWSTAIDSHRKKYEAAKQKSSSQEVTIKQIRQLENRIKEIKKYLLDKKQSILKAGDPEEKFIKLKEKWFDIHKKRGDILEKQCSALSRLSNDTLRASLGRGKGVVILEQALKDTLAGAKIRKDKIEDLCVKISESPNPVAQWDDILLEFEQLANFEADEESSIALPSTPILDSISFTANEIKRMSEKLNVENWIDLFLVELDDLPNFEYKARIGEYIDFSDASAGQQATALMNALLNQEGPPLVIDQPEDDLDNEMVSDISRLIWVSKKQRQLIFASHNANIVVNGDAELVACCSYKISGDQSKGVVEKQGAIDIEEIKNEITKVIEGGEEAFKLRKEKYGF